MGIKLVTNCEPAVKKDREIEIRLCPDSVGDMVVRLYENGTPVSSGRVGEFRVTSGKLEFRRFMAVNTELVHTDSDNYIRCC